MRLFNSARFLAPFLLGFLLILTPADAQEEAEPESPESKGTPSPLDGDWLQPCFSRFQKIESISGNQARLSENSFLDELCIQKQTSIISSGRIALGDEVPVPSGAATIDFTFETVEILLHSREAVRYFNSRNLCGFSDWKIGHAKEATGLACDLFGTGTPITIPSAGEKRFGIYQIQRSPEGAESLYFGKLTPTENAKTEAARPTQLDLRFYRKIR